MQITGTKDQILTKFKFTNLNPTKIYDLTIEAHKEKRGLTANGYYQSLLNQLVAKLNIGRSELHFRYLQDFSPAMLVPLLPEQEPSGYFKYYEKLKEALIGDKEAIYYKVYKPSSQMNRSEFSVLIKGVEEDCRNLDIEILEERKLKQLLDSWERNKK